MSQINTLVSVIPHASFSPSGERTSERPQLIGGTWLIVYTVFPVALLPWDLVVRRPHAREKIFAVG